MSTIVDSRGVTWTRYPSLCVSDDGRQMSVVPEMTDDYILSVIEQGYLPPVPQEVTKRQARQALILSGKYALVQPAISAITDPIQRALMQSEWDDSQDYQRQRPSLIQMAQAIGLTDADLDNLFILAATL